MHEVGHAFGLWDHETNPDESVMYMPADDLCALTEYDIAAVKSIYQSR